MGLRSIKMPDVGEGVAEAEIVEWHVKVGDPVREDQVIAAVMTDKATVEIPTPVAGTVLALGGAVGDVLAVGSELFRIDAPGLPDSPVAPAPKRAARLETAPESARPEPRAGFAHRRRGARRARTPGADLAASGVASFRALFTAARRARPARRRSPRPRCA